MTLSSRELEDALRQAFVAEDEGACTESDKLFGFTAGLLSPAEQEEFLAHLSRCDECKESLREEEEVNGPRGAWQLGVARTTRRRFGLIFPSVTLGLLAALAAAVLLVVVDPERMPWLRGEGGASAERLHVKGSFELHVAVNRHGQIFRAGEETRLQEGDELGLFYSTPKPGHMVVLYATEQGDIVRLFPAQRETSAPVAAGRELALPDGARVDAGSGCEWVVGLFSETSFAASDAVALVRQLVAQRRACQMPLPLTSSKLVVQVLALQRGQRTQEGIR